MPKLPEPRYPDNWEQSQKDRFDSILGRDLSSLLRESSTEFNFLELKEKVINVLDQVDTIAKNYSFWSELPENKRAEINSSFDDMTVQFNSMQDFDPKQNGAWELRNSLVKDFNTRYNTFYQNVVLTLNSFLGRRAYSQELTSKFGQEAQKELDEIRRVRKEIEAVQSVVASAATVAGDVASAAHAVSFSSQAAEHSKMARRWLTAVLAIMSISLIIALLVVVDIVRELSGEKDVFNWELSVLKLATLAFLYIAIRFTIKNYSAHQHLYVINKQRANVLQSVEAFRTSANTEETKDTVLLAAISAAYAQQETGFITTREGAGGDDSDITKIVETAIKR